MKTNSLTAARLRELLSYRPDTGEFVWIRSTSRRAKVGATAGYVGSNGYVQIRLDGVLYQAHRLAWLYVTENWPTSLIDHRDLNRSNNQWENLRLATPVQNSANSPARRHNCTGVKGVGLHRGTGKYRARIGVNGCQHHLGLFDTAEEAHLAYARASVTLHGEFGRLS